MNNPGSYSCGCINGYGLICKVCSDLDECVLNTHDCDHICTNNDGSFDCSCRQGYKLADLVSGSNQRKGCQERNDCDQQKDCVNINECTEGTHDCVLVAICIDTDGSFECECPDGFDGDGTVRNHCTTTMLRNTKCKDASCSSLICDSGFDGDPYSGGMIQIVFPWLMLVNFHGINSESNKRMF